MANKFTKLARQLLAIEEDLPVRLNYDCKIRPDIDDFEIYIFEQTWGSTALGFTGIGGQMMTSATTVVLVPVNCDQKCFVYFAGRFAYAADCNEAFRKDLAAGQMASVIRSGKYRKSE